VGKAFVDTFQTLIYLTTPCIWNVTTVDTLIAALSEPDIPTTSKTVAHTLLKDLALTHYKLFTTAIPTLAEWIITQSKEVSADRTREEKLAAEDILKCLARLGAKGLDLDLLGKQGKEFIAALTVFALNGETEKQGRRATTILLSLKHQNAYAEDLINVCGLLLLC